MIKNNIKSGRKVRERSSFLWLRCNSRQMGLRIGDDFPLFMENGLSKSNNFRL